MTKVFDIRLNKDNTLQGEQAWKLYKMGDEAWNDFMVENPETRVNFYGFDFSLRRNGNSLSFSNLTFPKGASFIASNFGDGDVFFERTNFVDGNVYFLKANFGDEDVFFEGTYFGDGDVGFDGANFGEGNVYFIEANFGDGDVSFRDVDFGYGIVFFNFTNFGGGDVSFQRVNFGEKGVYFRDTQFGKGNINLDNIQSGHFDFRCDKLGDVYQTGERDYSDIPNLPIPSIDSFSMEFSEIRNECLFTNLDFRGFKQVSFRGSSFEKLLDINGTIFSKIPNLTATSIDHHLAVDQMQVEMTTPFEAGDSAKARRLKELAKKAEDRRTELNMLALELDAMTSTKEVPFLGILLNRCYRMISSYGRSISRPIVVLMVTTAIACLGYAVTSCNQPDVTCINPSIDIPVNESLQLAISQALPFLTWSRTIKLNSIEKLFPNDNASLAFQFFEYEGLVQNFMSYICLFFIGLGIRNRFKL